MPISRYEIRNEYSLADPDLYRAAGNDDPEALLEGVAMAGLVGVLRQLGDLAEFAADIFHNLHEEAMATAARSHGLMSRVQQIETELPHIERAFLSQTDHSSFFNHTVGVEWHPNLRIEQNLITQGDLPRLVMDSYEECRPPPRLFLLDKFDVAGAGACLKRYSDPSFFKLENYGMTNADVVPREKKIRKAKKKGPLWKTEETAEVLTTSHTKLHQLFMEEARIENGGRNPAQHAKLKRKLDGFPFNTKTGNSYMEKFLKDTSPDNEVVREVTMNSTPLVSATYDYNESGLQVVEVRPVSPHRENVGRNRSPPSFSEREIIVNSSIDDNIRPAPNLYPSIAADVCISSTHNEKIIGMDSYRELGSLTSYQWDDIVSEVDNYVDATSTVESDTDATSTLRVNSDFIPSHVKSDSLISDENGENLQIMSFDSQSTGDLTISDEDNNSSRKGMSSFSSDSPSTSVENTQSNTISTRVFSPEIIDHFPVDDKHSRPFVSDVSCTNKKSDYEQATSGSRVVGKGIVEGTESNKTLSTLDDEEKRSTLVKDPPYSPSISRKSSAIPYIPRHKEDDSSYKVTSKLLHWNESDQEGQNSEENRAFKFNLFNVHSWETIGNLSERKSSEILIPGQDDEFQKLPDEFPSDYPDVVHNGDNVIKPMVSKEDSLIRGLANGNSDVSNDSPDRLSCFKDTFRKKKLEEISSVDVEAIDDEDDRSERSIGKLINSKDVVLSNLEKSSDGPWAGHDAHKRDVILEEYMAVNGNLVPGTRIGIKHHISPDDSEAQESSCSTLGEIKEPAGTSEYVEMDRTKSNGHEVTDKFPDEVRTLSMEDMSNTAYMVSAVPARADHASTGHEVTESFCSDDMISLNEVHILSDESDKSTLPDLASPVPALSDNLMMDNIPSEIDPTKLVEEKVHSFEDSGIDEPEFANNPLSESHWKLGLAEKVDQTEPATSDFENNNHPQSELSGNTVHNSHIDVKTAEQCLELIHPETTKLPVEQIFVNDEHDIPQQSCLGNQVSDSTSLHVADISIVQENIVLHSRGIYSEVPPVLPRINDQQIPDFLGSILPLSETNLTDTPPLPPLPPAQWMMMGKLSFGSSTLFPQLISDPIRSTDEDGDGDASSRYFPPTESTNNDMSPREEITLSLIQTANEPTLEEKLQLGSSPSFPQIISHPTRSTDNDDASYTGNPPTAYTSDDRSPLDDIAHSPIQTANEPASKEKPRPHLSSTEEETIQHNEIFPQIVSHPIVCTDEIKISPIQIPDKPALTEAKGESSGVEVNSMHESDLASKEDKGEIFVVDVNAMRKGDVSLKEEKSESSHVEVNSRHEPVDLTPMIENNQQQSVMMTEDDRVANGGEAVKIPRLRHPLIDEVTALDKSKLRKVTERLRTPQVQKADQRNSMLEQIRTKSFNLKPALATRPSYRGPSTNLRVAAIVEKANAIRQAFAGSDEDDDDSWSDS